MSRRTAMAWLTVLMATTGACSHAEEGRHSSASQASSDTAVSQTPMRPVALPDVSSLEGSVQDQMRGRFARLDDLLKRPAAPPTDLAAAYGDLGRLFLAVGFDEEAVSCYLHAQAAAPADPRWPYLLGHAYLRSALRDRAAEAFAHASRMAPADINSLIWLGATYLDSGRLDDAQDAFSRALALNPQSAAALFGAGRVALARGSYRDAVNDLERVLAIDSRASAVQYPLAMAYRGLGDLQKADAHRRLRGDGTPELDDPLMQSDDAVLDSTVGFEHRGMQDLKQADFVAAIGEFREGLALNPNDVTLRYWLGAALYASGDAASAEKEFRSVVQRAPSDAKAHFSLGAIDEAQGRHREAIEEYSAAVRSDPTLPEARLRLASALRTSGDLQASLIQYQRAVDADPRVLDAWIGGAQALVGLSQYGQARDWLSRARRVYPDRKELADLEARLPH